MLLETKRCFCVIKINYDDLIKIMIKSVCLKHIIWLFVCLTVSVLTLKNVLSYIFKLSYIRHYTYAQTVYSCLVVFKSTANNIFY